MDESSRERIERQLTPGLARVRAPSGAVAGAGFLVSPQRMVTCAHVVNSAVGAAALASECPTDALMVDFPGSPEASPIGARVSSEGWFPIAEDGRGDVAVLELLEDPPGAAAPPPLRRPPGLMDHGFHVEGFPQVVESAWATGVIRGATGPGREWVQLEAVELTGRAVEHGFSGAPVWDDEAQAVVGMVVAADRLREARVAEMIPVSVLVRRWPALEAALGWQLRFDPERRRHWVPRARGLERARRDEQRWLFSGRVRALRELVDWLNAAPGADRYGRVVTSLPGSGKSAVLSRLVTLADPYERAHAPLDQIPEGTLPPVGIVDVAVHAKGKTLANVVDEIAAGLDLAATSAEALVNALLEAELARTVVVDALDEAGVGEAAKIAVELLQPLAVDGSEFGLKVLVGTRGGPGGELLRKLGSRMRVLDLDAPEYLKLADLAEYVRRTLLEGPPDSPYREQPQRAVEVAEAVARRANPSFLVAQLVGRDLHERDEPVDTSTPRWQGQLPNNVGDAMERYLHRLGPDEQRVRDLLRPLAYAEGVGLPAHGEVWPAVAAGLAGQPYTPPDVTWLLRSPAAAYLIEGGEVDGALTYRLYHEALAEYLRAGKWRSEQQVRFTEALLKTVPTLADGSCHDWRAADPYLRQHLATHAAAAGALDPLVEDPGYLIAADPNRLLLALPLLSAPAASQARRVYRHAFDALRRCPPVERASYLEMAARQVGTDHLANQLARREPSRPWSARWARWRPVSEHFIAGRHDGSVLAVAVGELDGQPIAVSGGEDGTLRVWDLAAGGQRGEPLTGHDGSVLAVSVGALDGRPIAVSAGEDGTLRVWDLAAGGQRGEPLTGHDGEVRGVAVGELDGRPIAVSGGEDGTLRVWDLVAGGQRGEPLTGHDNWVSAVTIGELDGRPIAVSGGEDETLRVWDLAAAAQRGEPLTGHDNWVSAVTIGELDGRPIAVSGSDDGTLRVWDVAAGTQHGEPLTGHDIPVPAVAIGELDGQPIAVSGGGDRTLRVWDLAAGGQRGEPLTGHDGWVMAVSVGELDGRPIAVSGGGDGTLRVWDLAAGGQRGEPPTGHDGWVMAVAAGELDGRPIAVSGGGDGTLRVWDPAVGGQRGEPLTGHDGWVSAVSVGELDGRPIAVSGGEDGTLRVWDLAVGGQRGEPLTGHAKGVSAVAVGELDGRPIAVSGGGDGTLRVWDLAAGGQRGEPLTGHDGPVSSVAIGELDGRPIAVSGSDDGTLRVWDLAAGGQRGEPLTGHDGPVSSVAIGELDGRPIAVSGGGDGTLRVWDLAAGGQRGEPLTGHDGDVRAVAVGELDGRPSAVSGSYEWTLRIWELNGNRRSAVTIGAAVKAIAFTPPSATLIGATAGVMLIEFAGVWTTSS